MKSALILAIPFALLACNPETNVKEPVEDRQSNRGRISIPLTSTSSSGTTYYLHLPSVIIEGEENTVELSFEENEEFDMSLQEGEYTLTLQEWTLYRVVADEMSPVAAEITSDNPQLVIIHGGETTHSVIRFRTINEDLTFEYGNLEVDFEVEEEEINNSDQSDSGVNTPVECGTQVYQGDITFTEQNELDQFVLQYNTVLGEVSIEGQDIYDASGLACIESTSLAVSNTSIAELNLSSQESIHILQIEDNPSLEVVFISIQGIGHLNIAGNQELMHIETEHNSGYTFIVEDNPVLQSISLPFLQENYLDFYMIENPSLHSIHAPELEYVADRIKVEGNASLVELDFPSLEMTGASVSIQENETLQRVAMPELFVVGELSHSGSRGACLSIGNNDSLTTTLFPELFYVARHLDISNNALLETLDGFDTLVSVDDLTIIGNARLRNVMELATLTEVDRVNISFNPHLSEAMVNYLYEVEIGADAVEGNVHIANNSQVSLEEYGSSSCSAEYTAVQSGDFYPVGSVVSMSSAETQCSPNEVFADGTVWEISGDCSCN
jgi:hypothetical protein